MLACVCVCEHVRVALFVSVWKCLCVFVCAQMIASKCVSVAEQPRERTKIVRE